MVRTDSIKENACHVTPCFASIDAPMLCYQPSSHVRHKGALENFNTVNSYMFHLGGHV